MTREDAEAKIYEHMKAIRAICREYYPEDEYFDGSISEDYISFNNSHWDHKETGVLRFSKFDEENNE